MGRLITLEEGLSTLEECFGKAAMILDGYPTNALFNSEEYMKFYHCVYVMCVQPEPCDYSLHLCHRFEQALVESIYSKVLPSLQDKNDAFLLKELTNMWAKYKAMAKCLGGFFLYIDRAYKIDASLSDVSVRCFRDHVCTVHYQKFQEAAVSLINQDRNDNPTDRGLLKNVSTFFFEMGNGKDNTHCYINFEKAILADAASYYSRLASEWLACCSSVDYMKKAESCLNNEIQRVSQYLHQTTAAKLLQVLQWEMMGQTASKLIEKQKVENHDLATYQELLSRCASLSIGDGTVVSPS
ncbi:cullin-1-like [Actinidia eriantha]|uniref:cullin-1-like n=1 Tax=Actinidia eriantha TaxID=165200 RepID=UPI00258283AF|nr:cullin-1-like [Actinidia eriantha]